MRAAIADLAEVDRDLLTLALWEGLTVAEASDAVGLEAGAGRVRLHRARQRLAQDSRVANLLTERSGAILA